MRTVATMIVQGSEPTKFDDVSTEALLPLGTDMFAELGKSEHVGLAFAITSYGLEDDYGGDFGNVPTPDYEHRIYLDTRTDNYLVLRPAQDGSYYAAESAEGWTRIR